ncbi:MAG: hypothetical protein KatS3mg023_3914 [Armatimonadota bacterium]|nr:MAG: hypothetical protein KatS3mg023_3914 [Armatimonadota bacterium]
MDWKEWMPPLSECEYEALKADIAEHGVLVPIVLDAHGAVVDGHHRLRACEELGIKDYPVVVRQYPDEDSRTEDVLKLNLQRRHIDRARLKELAVRLYSELGWSQSRIARVLGVSQASVSGWVSERLQLSHQVINFDNLKQSLQDSSTGADGKRYPRSVLAKNRREAKMAQELLSSLDAEDTEKLPNVADTRDLRLLVRRAHVKKNYSVDASLPAEVAIYNEDFRTGSERIADDSVQLIFTDPPYGKEYLPLYEDLARFAAAKLQDGGSLLCYVGHYALPEVLSMMGKHLRYFWVVSEHGYEKVSRCAQMIGVGVSVAWKPILWFVKGGRWNPEVFVQDAIELPSLADKNYHAWAQHLETPTYYIQWLTQVGDTVVDPFAGSGTTLIAAANLRRNAIGFEVDAGHYQNAVWRMQHEVIR